MSDLEYIAINCKPIFALALILSLILVIGLRAMALILSLILVALILCDYVVFVFVGI